MSSIDGALREVAALGLRPIAELPPIKGEGASSLVQRARSEKLVGLLDQAVASGALAVPDAVADDVAAAAEAVAGWCLRVERQLLAVHDVLDAASIEHRFLKGPTIAHRFEPHPALRTYVDVDVLVPARHVDGAAAVLGDAGHARVHPEFRRGYSGRYGKSVTLRGASGVEVDLHRVLASGPYGLVASPVALWERPAAEVVLGGVAVPALDPVAAFVAACVHAVTGQRLHLASLRDVARLCTAADPAEVEPLARALGVTACVTEGVRLAWEELALAPSERATRYATRAVGRRDRRWLALYDSGTRFRVRALAGIAAVPGIRGKLAYAWMLGRPR